MLKFIITFFIFILFAHLTRAQKSFDITIKLDSSIILKNIHYQYNNGMNTIFLPDTFGEKRTIVFKDIYYSPLASFNINYTDTAQKYYDNDFFIGDKPAVISFYFKTNKQNKLNYNFIENATPIYDTAVNKSWGKLNAFMIDSAVAKENNAFDAFLEHNKNFLKNDSLKNTFYGFYKRRLNRIMLFLKKYPDDYFSFWYFTQQVSQVSGVLKQDTAYLKTQLAYLKSVFPAQYTGSIQGKELIKGYEAIINPLRLHNSAPAFSFTTIDGKKVSLNGFKGKYVLLDFWATWCPPCLAEIPFIKTIRKNYSQEKLAIIGISADFYLKPLLTTVKKQEMNWLHFHDKNREIGRLYGVEAYPKLVLINKEGKMLYDSSLMGNDQSKLSKLLESLN